MRLSLAGGIPKNPTRRLYLLGILGINGEAPRISWEYPRTPQEALSFGDIGHLNGEAETGQPQLLKICLASWRIELLEVSRAWRNGGAPESIRTSDLCLGRAAGPIAPNGTTKAKSAATVAGWLPMNLAASPAQKKNPQRPLVFRGLDWLRG